MLGYFQPNVRSKRDTPSGYSISHLIQTIILRYASQFALQVDYLCFFSYDLDLKLIALFLQLPNLLAILVFIDQTLGHEVLSIIS